MTKSSSKHSSFSNFGDSLGVADEWKEMWAKFAAESQKKMAQSMENFGIPPTHEMKKPPSPAEWKEIWTKVAKETQKTITKSMANFGVSPAHEIKNPPTPPEWKEFWTKFSTESQKAMAQTIDKLGMPPLPEMKNPPSPPEWEEFWKKFTAESQKAMAQSMKNLGIPPANEMKKPHSAPEWEEFWKKFTAESQKTMTQSMKKFGMPPVPEMKSPPSPDELKELWTKFTAESQKKMTQTMQNLGMPPLPEMKSPPSPDELKELWTKFTAESQKKMTQTMQNLGMAPLPEMKSPHSPAEWKELWTKFTAESQRTMTQTMQDLGIGPSLGIGNTIFNPEVMSKTFAEAMSKMAKKPEKFNKLQSRYVQEFQELLQSSINRLQGKITKIFVEPGSTDKRFQDPEWTDNPFFSLLQQAYLLNAKFLQDAVNCIEGLDPITLSKLKFYTSHLIDALSPTNFPLTNPTVLQETLATCGNNLVRGYKKYMEDVSEGQWHTRITDMKAFELGKDLATTPGKVVFQNDLFQLIQYEPISKRVAKRPLLIIPPWINKYYIFDLKPENSFVRWALESGLTVFIISWVNPDKRHAKKTITNYTLDGVKVAVDQVCKITGEKQLNAIGYCNGGTLLSFLMVYLKKSKENPIASATLLATPFDFSKADEMGIYRCEHQQRKLEQYVQKKGYLEGQYMVQAFNLLRANDLIWSSYINNYLLGRESFPFDMLYWSGDALRMPAKMHMTYLRDVVVENRLMKPGSMYIDDVPVDLKKISTPLFVVATYSDHIAPWRSVYPITQMATSKSKKFVLGASGHVAGIINPPSRQKYQYWTSKKLPKEADEWFKSAEKHEGSWWEEWRQWLDGYGDGTVPARAISKELILEAAPGSYALTVAD